MFCFLWMRCSTCHRLRTNFWFRFVWGPVVVFHSCDYLIKYVVFLGVEANWWTWQQGVVCPLRWTEVSPVTGGLHSLSSWRLHFREGNGSSLENCVALCLRFWQSFAFPSAEPGLEAAQSSCVRVFSMKWICLWWYAVPPAHLANRQFYSQEKTNTVTLAITSLFIKLRE